MTSSLNQLRALTWQELIGDEYEELTAYCALRFKKDEAAPEAAQSDAERTQSEAVDAQSEPLFEVPSYLEMHAQNLHAGDRIVVSDSAPTASLRGERGVIIGNREDLLCLVQFESGEYSAAYTRYLIREKPTFRKDDWVRVLQSNADYSVRNQFSREIQAGWIGRVVCINDTDSIPNGPRRSKCHNEDIHASLREEKNALIRSAFQAFLGVNRIQNAVKTMLLDKNLVMCSINPLQICNIKSKIFNLRL